MTIIKAWMSLNFCQIPLPTTELAALECLKNQCIMLWALKRLHFDWLVVSLAGNDDNHKSLDEFEFRLDPITDYGVIANEHLKIDV